MNLEIVEKAYELNLDKIRDGFHCSEVIVYAETRGQAKQKISGEIDLEDYEIEYVGKMTFLNMPVRRCKISDKVKYKDKILKRWQLEDILKLEKHNAELDKILEDKSITHCYIRKRGNYYCWNMAGYTSFRHKAGVYLKDEAVEHCKNIIELDCVPINIPEHNEILLNEIARIKKGVIA